MVIIYSVWDGNQDREIEARRLPRLTARLDTQMIADYAETGWANPITLVVGLRAYTSEMA